MLDRTTLTEIIEKEDGVNWWKPELFAKHIRPQLPVELEVVASPPEEKGNYNCFAFAFGLEKDTYFLGGNNPIQEEFIRYLLEKRVLRQKEQSTPRDLVFYEDNENHITHGGFLEEGNKVLSKWMWGPIIRHDLWDVPSSFGNKVFYTNRPPANEVKKEYEAYKTSGVEIRSIA